MSTTTIGKLNFMVGADSSAVSTGLKPAQSAIAHLKSLASGFSLGGLLGGLTAGGAIGWGVKLASEAEQAQVGFEVLLGSGQKATKMLDDLRKMGAATPFETTELRGAAQLLLNYGVAGDAILPTLKMLGDVSGGNAQKLESLALAFGQMSSTGRMTGQDLNQMINAGFNPLVEISKRTGEQMADLKKRMEEGGVSTAEVTQAFRDATGEGGRFFGMMDKQSETLAGRFSTLKDNVANLFTEMGEKLLPVLKQLTETGIGVVDWLNNLDASTVKSTIEILAMVGAFGAAIKIVPMVVKAGASIVKTLQAIAKGQSIMQAMSGPTGWITLGAGLIAAGAASVAVDQMFGNIDAGAKKAAASAEKAGKEVKNLAKAQNDLAKVPQSKNIATAEKAMKSASIPGVGSSGSGMAGKDIKGLGDRIVGALTRVERGVEKVEKAVEKKQVIKVTQSSI